MNVEKELMMKQWMALLLILLLVWVGLGRITAVPAATWPDDREWVVVQARFNDPAQVAALAQWTEPWHIDQQAQVVVLGVDAAGYGRLQQAGFALTIDEALTAAYSQPRLPLVGQSSGIPGYPCYRTVEETYATAAALAAQAPQLAEWVDIGDSWQKANGSGGYDLLVLRLTNEARPGPKPTLFIMTAVHAREYATAELATRFAELLIAQYGHNADITWLLDYHEIHLLLHANPDGRKEAESGVLWRKNSNADYCTSFPAQRGADLNRNFSFGWGCCGGSSSSQCSDVYRGATAVSEPETVAIETYVRSQFPDLREPPLQAAAPITTTGLFLDLHSYGQLVLWPWGFTTDAAPNGPALQTLGRKLAYFNSYWPEQAIGLYPTDGTTDDFAYGELGLPAYTLELGTSFFQSCSSFEGTILPANMPALLYAAKAASQPYLAPAGPEVTAVTLAADSVVAGQVVMGTAVLDDTRYNQQNGVEPAQPIAAGRLTVGLPPWELVAPPPISLTPQDGVWDTAQEPATFTLDTTGWPNGRYPLYLQAQDAAGNWGVVTAVYLHIDPITEWRLYLPTLRR
jgi:hypothetical protein